MAASPLPSGTRRHAPVGRARATPGAATDALSAFVNGRTLSANQHDFVALVVEHLTANGVMEPGLLYEPPFTDVATGGPEGPFLDAEVDVLISVIAGIRATPSLRAKLPEA